MSTVDSALPQNFKQEVDLICPVRCMRVLIGHLGSAFAAHAAVKDMLIHFV